MSAGAHGADPKREPPVSAALALGALGIVFGDLGTSPLYAMQECFTGAHGVPVTQGNVYGVLSLVFWSLLVVVTVKYLVFLMRADNRGEGGIFALLALLPKGLSSPAPGRVGWVGLLVIIGAALLFGDGVITPAISVLSAVEGVGIATDALKPAVLPLAVVILAVLFAVQSRGTGGLAALFGPVMLGWFLSVGLLGTLHIVRSPGILAALSPTHAVAFFAAHKLHGIRTLGGVVLVVTGGEALYADMGHFGRKPIQAAWLVVCLPMLLLCYLGQGVVLLEDPTKATTPFYSLCPRGPWLYALVGLATCATVIASQALISGVFSLVRQGVQLGLLPRVTIVHTSAEAEGQIYVPFANWALAASCIALVLAFQKSSALAAAYGLAVSGTMGITSVAFFLVTSLVWKWPAWRSWLLLVVFLSFDLPFLVANLLKFFDGGWLPLALGLVMTGLMLVWSQGRGLLAHRVQREMLPVDDLWTRIEQEGVHQVPGTAVFMASLSTGAPPVLVRILDRFGAVYEHNVLLTVQTADQPRVPAEERVSLEEIRPGFYRAIVRFGFMQTPRIPATLEAAFAANGLGKMEDTTYVLGRERIVPGPGGMISGVREEVFALLVRNARNATDHFGLPPAQVIELGSQIDL